MVSFQLDFKSVHLKEITQASSPKMDIWSHTLADNDTIMDNQSLIMISSFVLLSDILNVQLPNEFRPTELSVWS